MLNRKKVIRIIQAALIEKKKRIRFFSIKVSARQIHVHAKDNQKNH